jgi:dihydropteroate synthase
MHLLSMFWHTARFRIALDVPQVMGIVNVTPDSFSDGGLHASTGAALRRCEAMLEEGATILDLGAESSRPGSTSVPAAQELERLLPVLRGAVTLGVPVSVDTYKPQVMQAALDLGADIVNDIWALRWHDAAAGEAADAAAGVVAAHSGCGVCLMHMHGEPSTMQREPMQGDAPTQVRDFLVQAAASLRQRGVAADRIVLDPGVGFGKTVEQNFSLLAQQPMLMAAGYPLLVGWSRKSSLGAIVAGSADALGARGVADGAGAPGAAGAPSASVPSATASHPRMVSSVAAALLAVERGARIVRVHDVRETVAALRVWRAATAPGTAIPS